MKRTYSDSELTVAVQENLSIAGVLRQLNLNHAQTNNYRGRAQLSALSEKRDAECRKFKEALTEKADGNLEPSLIK